MAWKAPDYGKKLARATLDAVLTDLPSRRTSPDLCSIATSPQDGRPRFAPYGTD